MTSERALERDLSEIRARGFALALEEMSVGAVSCAAPIKHPGDSIAAAVSVVMPAGEASPRTWSSAVMAAAFGIGRAMAQHRPQAALSAHLTGA
jgi:DNA-binding IclR family transcriptional regulator